MSYLFRGFFARTIENGSVQHIVDMVHQHYPSAVFRLMRDPFVGIGVQLPEESESIFRADRAFIDNGPPLLDWSKQCLGTTFVYIEAECFGICNYWGYVCHEGRVLHCEAVEVDGDEPLIRLLRYLGVASSGHFAPFERGFFDEDKAI